jgi:hypothetical protein
MSKKTMLVIFIALIATQYSFGQNAEDIFTKSNEIYFSFTIHSKEDIHSLTNIISIDNVRGDTVWAYANMPEFIKFSGLGYHITLLPHPGDVEGIEMTDHMVRNTLTTWNYYPTYSAYENLMYQFQATYPAICQIQTIATLGSGRKIMVAKISDNVATNEAEPEFLYTSSIHGDETTGYILMLHLMDYLLSNYGTNSEITDLINNMEIFINPLANPDGTYYGGNSTVNGARRYNANGVDLNRNYPDPQDGQHPDGNAWQPETVAFMDFASARHFVASCNFHGGAEVVNYPWDTWATLHADDNWWQYISHEYVDTARIHGNTSYMTNLYASGITNGYAWYEVNGGRQDYMNYWHHCREITIELSVTKLLPAASLLTYWEYNYRSFILLMKEARYGIHGIITSAVTGLPVAAKVVVTGHESNNSETYSSATPGDYSRPIKAGTYTLEVSATNYATKTIAGVVVADHATTNLNIQLVPLAVPIVITQAATSISATSAIVSGSVNPNGFSTTYSFEWGTSTNYGNTTTTTSAGAGMSAITVSASLSGLSGGTLYHYRLNATNSIGTTNGTDMTFSFGFATLETIPATSITTGTVNTGGLISTDGGVPITGRGTCWSTSLNPTISGSHTSDGTGTGSFVSSLTGLSASTTYHIRAYAINSTGTYYGPDLVFSTPCGIVSAFPWNEGFENAGEIPYCWTNEQVNTSGINWLLLTGSGNLHPTATHGGFYNACLKDASTADNKTKLITPAFNLASLSNPVLKFWHTQAVWSGRQDQLTVYYRTSLAGSWTVLSTYTASLTAWTQETINLPNASGEYFIAFEGNAKYGYGVCLDDVSTTGTMKTLAVAPPNQQVTALSGNTSFTVTSNSSWSAVTDQLWCTVTAAGTGNGAIIASYSQNPDTAPRVAHITVTVTGLTPTVVSVTQEGAVNKVLNLTVLLESLFNGTNMNKAKNASGDQFAGQVADQITVELRGAVSPYTLLAGPFSVNLNIDGTASTSIPPDLAESYFIVVRHRNSIETWSAVPVSFSGLNTSYDFSTSASQAFGNNMKMVSGKQVLLTGDVNQDGMVDSGDMVIVDNSASLFMNGYLPSDTNGDGTVNAADYTVTGLNASTFVARLIP